MYSSRIAICPVGAQDSVIQKVRIAIIRALPAMVFVVVVGVALVGCGGEKELVRQDLSVIKPDKCMRGAGSSCRT